MDISAIMTTAVLTAKPDDHVGDALRVLDDQLIRHLPVVEDGRLVGMVSDRDLREYRLPLLEEVEHPDRAETLMRTSLADVMNPTVITVEPSESLQTAIDLILEYGVGALPVVDSETGTLIGIISYVDILRALRNEIEDL